MTEINLTSIYQKSDEVIAKAIEDELIIVTMTDGISNADSSIYTLNPTGKVVWEKLDGKSTLKEIIALLSREYDAAHKKIEADVKKLMADFIQKKLVVKI